MLIYILIISAILFFIAYKFYAARYISKILEINDANKTPAHQMFDGVDYCPTRAPVLFGHHFSSIAGAGPIVGPVIVSLAFGWLPSLLWIIIGAIFIGGVHDFTTIVASIRHKARSIAEIALEYISPLSYKLFLLFIFLTIAYILTVFIDLTKETFVENSGVATSSIFYIFLALLFGFFLYRLKLPLLPLTIIFVSLVFLGIWIGQKLPLNPPFDVKTFYYIILILYIFIASILPVWFLLQPRDYLSSFLLYVTVVVGLVGILFGNFEIKYPSYKGFYSDYLGPLFPVVFTTVACGAISGFHAMVSSGTTSKQLNKESDALKIGYGGMLTEGIVAVIAICTVITIAMDDPNTKKQPLEVYAGGIGKFSSIIGIPYNLGFSFGLLALSTFILTTLDTATRIGRYIFQEFFNFKGVLSRVIGSISVLIIPVILLLIELKDTKGNPLPSWKAIWPVFGATNQLLSALVLLVLIVYLRKKGKKFLFLILPMFFMIVVTLWTLFSLVLKYKFSIVGIISFFLIILSFALIFETIRSLKVRKKDKNAPSQSTCK